MLNLLALKMMIDKWMTRTHQKSTLDEGCSSKDFFKNLHSSGQKEGIKSKMILQVHDELNFTVLPEEKEKLQKLVIEEMESACKMRVPLIADCGWGKNWLEAH